MNRSIAIVTLGCLIMVSAATADSVKSPAAESGDDIHHSIPYLTVRNKTGESEPVKFFGGERDILRAGYCDVLHTKSPALKSIADNVPFYVPEDILNLDAVREAAVDDLWSGIDKSREGRRPILYVHGFNISFDRGCRRVSEFQRSLDLAGRLVFFSWPSDGVIVNYTRDEADIYWSVQPLQQTVRSMAERYGAGEVDLVAHSLGARGVMLALVRIADAGNGNDTAGRQRSKPLINHIVFIAPDIDAGIFEQYISRFRSLAKHITIYVSSNDMPLALSEQAHGYPRLGQAGSHLDGLTGIEIIDVSDIPVQYPSGHVYHLYNDDVVADMYQLIVENRSAVKRKHLKKVSENYWRLAAVSDEKLPDSKAVSN